MGKRILRSIWRTKRKDNKSILLALSKREEKFQVETDVSGHAIRGVLSQEQEGR